MDGERWLSTLDKFLQDGSIINEGRCSTPHSQVTATEGLAIEETVLPSTLPPPLDSLEQPLTQVAYNSTSDCSTTQHQVNYNNCVGPIHSAR